MGYYLRVFSPQSIAASSEYLKEAIASYGANLRRDVESSAWDQVVATDSTGDTICIIERNEVLPGSLGEAELAEFQDEISTCFPNSAVAWLKSYLGTVRTIYALQILSTADAGNGWKIVDAVRQAIVDSVGGIVQADGEGFSNEDGYHVLWQFSDNVQGDWWMAVLKDGQWQKFKMDLGDAAHRAAFLAGDIPEGVEHA